MNGFNFFKNGLYGNKIIKLAKKYDIVQSSEYDQIYNIKLSKKIGEKLIIYHGPYYDKFNKGYNLKCKIFDNIFLKLNNEYKKIPIITKSTLATEFIKNKKFSNVVTIGVGLDEENFSKTKMDIENKAIEELKNAKERKKYLLYIGKIEERRNIKQLLKITKEIYKQNKNIKLIIVGNGEKTYVEECFNYAKDIGIINCVTHIKSMRQDELLELYNLCDVFLLPTSYDIFGMVLLEAMYQGLPVITTPNGGSNTIIENGKNGFIYNLNEEENVIQKILKLLQDEKYRKEIGENASITIKEKFLWSKLVEKFLNEYKKIKAL